MARFECQGRPADLSYSTNVHPAEDVDQLLATLRNHVAPVSRGAFGSTTASVNLRLGMKQADELLDHGPLPSTSTLSDEILSAARAPEPRHRGSVGDHWRAGPRSGG